MELELTAEQLASELDAEAKAKAEAEAEAGNDAHAYTPGFVFKSRPYAFNGFALHLKVDVAPGETFVGVSISLQTAHTAVEFFAARVSFSVFVSAHVNADDKCVCLPNGCVRGITLDMTDPWDIAQWQRYMADDGKLRVTATVTECI